MPYKANNSRLQVSLFDRLGITDYEQGETDFILEKNSFPLRKITKRGDFHNTTSIPEEYVQTIQIHGESPR